MKVSIITVCFNSVNTIADTIKSVLSQDYPNIEYIIVDGGSTDGTVDLIRKHGQRVSQWISEKDRGMYDAMNKGIAMATGDVIGILNSEDVYINSNVITKLMHVMRSQNTEVVFADLVLVDPDNPNKVVRYYDSGRFHPNKFKFGWMPAHPTVFVRRELYQRVGPFSTTYQIAADYEMLIRMLAIEKASYAYYPKPVVRMRIGGASTSGISRSWILNQEIVRACKENGIYTNLFYLFFKIPAKLWDRLFPKNSKLDI